MESERGRHLLHGIHKYMRIYVNIQGNTTPASAGKIVVMPIAGEVVPYLPPHLPRRRQSEDSYALWT